MNCNVKGVLCYPTYWNSWRCYTYVYLFEFIVDSRNLQALRSQNNMSPIPVPIVRIFPLKETLLMPQPLFLDDIFLTGWRVLLSNKSVWALDPTAYIWQSSSVERHTFSMVWGSLLLITCFILTAFQQWMKPFRLTTAISCKQKDKSVWEICLTHIISHCIANTSDKKPYKIPKQSVKL